MPESRKTVTILDVARAAGVSIKTVSRVINNDGYVSDEMRQRVQTVIDRLDYRPNRAARNLASNRSAVIGLLVPDVTNPYFPEVVRGVEDAALKKGYNVLLFNTQTNTDKERNAFRFLEEHRVDGAIIYLPYIPREELATVLSRQKASVVVDSYPLGKGAGSIRVDFYDAAEQAIRHLVSIGRRNIGYIGPIKKYYTFQERYHGMVAALEAEGIPVRPEYFVELQRASMEDHYAGTRTLLTEHPEVDGLICFNDMGALGAMKACDDLGVAIPERVALMGFDDIPFAGLSRISLTTMRVPKFEVGVKSFEMLLNRINGVTEPAEYIVRTELVQRNTTAISPPANA
ncbi:MAG: LacI family DNA-binding transcriptional regulator [Anaerolineae bacterium]|nr:LacI family DNA-binding transcriptional regulator [Anaerolineae bacterium]